MRKSRMYLGGWLVLALLLGVGEARSADEPARPWQQEMARRQPGGLLEWAPQPFVFTVGEEVRHIDPADGDDRRDGRTRATAWRHAPWDERAEGLCRDDRSGDTFLFKRGTVYRGGFRIPRSGTPERPLLLTIDPSWGEGEAILQGSRALSGPWSRLAPGEAPEGLPEPEQVWVTDAGRIPVTGLWLVEGDRVTRLPLAREPDWVADPDRDYRAGWAEWAHVEAVRGEPLDRPRLGAEQFRGIDPVLLTATQPDAYQGATLWTEYAGLMGSPYPSPVLEYDPARHALHGGGPWNGAHRPVRHARYFLENHPRLLDTPGEYFHDAVSGRLYLRLPDDANPAGAALEAARDTVLLTLEDPGHLHLAGLSFRFLRVPQVYDRFWAEAAQDPDAIKVLGNVDDLRVTHCRFTHLPQALRVAPRPGQAPESHRVGRVVFSDNDCADLDYAVLDVAPAEDEARGVLGTIDRVEILRNRARRVGSRPLRAFHGHALTVRYVTCLTVAGNILERTHGAGIMLWGGKPDGDNSAESPLTRMLVFQNQVSDSLLTSNDWGGIETWQGGPAYLFDNVSLRPGGYWGYLDVPTRRDWAAASAWPGDYPAEDFPLFTPARAVAGLFEREGRNYASAGYGFAYYLDGAFKQYLFNNLAVGRDSDPASPRCSTGGFSGVAGGFLHQVFNNTFHRFGTGTSRGGAFPSVDLFVGNLYQDLGDLFLRHERARHQPDEQNATHQLPDADPEGGRPGPALPVFLQAFGHNLFAGRPHAFGTILPSGRIFPDLASFREALQSLHPILGTVGEVAGGPLLRDPDAGDFRPAAGSPAETAGVLVFVPWGLSATVGEWNFHRIPSQPNLVPGEHWFMTAEHRRRGQYRHLPRHHLSGVNLSADSYHAGVLEDWTDSALRLNGRDQWLVLSDASLRSDLLLPGEKGQPDQTVPGATRRTPDLAGQNLLIEAVLRVEPGRGEGGLVAKWAEHGYCLDLSEGRPRLRLRSPARSCTAVANVPLDDGHWHHLLVEVDRSPAGGIRFHLDGITLDAAVEGDLPGPEESLSNPGDFLVGRSPEGRCLEGSLDFLRVAQGTLAQSRTDLAELRAWQFDGPFRRTLFGWPLGPPTPL